MSKKRKVARCLRSYQRIADKNYSCSRCIVPIFAGDPYIGEVWVYGKYLWIKRFHDYCPVDPEEEDRRMKEVIEWMEKNDALQDEMKEAA